MTLKLTAKAQRVIAERGDQVTVCLTQQICYG